MSFLKFRFRNFFVHLAASSCLALLAMLLVFQVWYPSPFQAFLGVTAIFLMLLGIDVIVGPILTFIVSKPNKKSLKFDLTVIVLLQLSAFIYGMHVVSEGRPVWVVFSGDRFEVVQAYELEDKYFDGAVAPFNSLPLFGPKWAGAVSPEDAEARNELLFTSVAGGADLAQRPNLYVDYNTQRNQVSAMAHPIDDLDNNNDPDEILKIKKKWPNADSYLPLYSRLKSKEMTVLLNSKSGEVVAVVDLIPW